MPEPAPTSRATRKILTATFAVAVLLALGTLGYRLIEGWSWFECFYMTLITLATIGYREPENITESGRYFTAALIISGVWTVGYAIAMLTQAAVQGELLAGLEKRRLQDRLNRLSGHYIICGSGRVGSGVARGLAAEGVDFVVIDSDRQVVESMSEAGWLAIHGDATREEVLQRAGIERARALVCALSTDADNVFIVLTARDMTDSLQIVARVNDDSTIPKMRKAGADKIISPVGTGARQILQSLLRPTVAEFIEFATMKEGLDLVIEEIPIHPGSPLSDRTLKQSDVRRTLDVIIIAILRQDGKMLFNPTADTVVRVGDKVIAIGNRAGIVGLEALALQHRTAP